MNVAKLKEWSESSPQAKAMYAYLLSRKRGTRGGKPSDLKHIVSRLCELGFTLSPVEVATELTKLEAMGVGTLEHKPNRRSKWRWASNPAAIAKLLLRKSSLGSSVNRVDNGPGLGILNKRRVIRIQRGDTTIEASPEDLIEVLTAINMR